jgi:conjugal transfer/entry exclusion protein
MTEKSDVVALEQILNYVAQEAQRLQLSPVVVHCLRMAAFELAKSTPAEDAMQAKDRSLH